MEINNEQINLCKKYNIIFFPIDEQLKIGISKDFDINQFPINGLRHPLEGDTSGWYIWSGEYSDAEDFFVPLHIYHIKEKFPKLYKYLCLPPSSRFLIGENDYEDVWEDLSLLEI